MGCSGSTPATEAPQQEGGKVPEGAAKKNQRRRRLSVLDGGGSSQLAGGAQTGAQAFPNAVIKDSADQQAANLPLRYACYSRPGNDPMKNAKENQDSMTVIENYGAADQMFIAVFDGHGQEGAHASQFVRDILPQRVLTPTLANEPFVALSNGCIKTNKELSASQFDVHASGSTGIISVLQGNKLFIANVGDSRAVLGRVSGRNKVKAVDLSHDHKPDRPDEKARILSRGGRVFEWGVPRVWLADQDMPGLAMARSFGDEAAESVGVFAEPELSKVTLTASHKFVMWASDGVWEFISSQEACEIVFRYYSQGPRKAANALVQESVKRWNIEEDVVDDTTVVLLFLDFPSDYQRATATAGEAKSAE